MGERGGWGEDSVNRIFDFEEEERKWVQYDGYDLIGRQEASMTGRL